MLGWVYLALGHVPAIAGVLYGIKPAVTAIVVFATYRIGSRALKNGVLWMMAAVAFFAYPVLWPQGFTGRFDGISAAIGLCGLLALFRYKIGVIPVIIVSGLAGLLFAFLKSWLIQEGFLL